MHSSTIYARIISSSWKYNSGHNLNTNHNLYTAETALANYNFSFYNIFMLVERLHKSQVGFIYFL